MVIDVTALGLGERLEFEFDDDVKIGDVPARVHTKGSVEPIRDGYMLNGRIKAVLQMNCDLCLSAFETVLELPFEEIFSNAAADKDTNENDGENTEKEFWPYEDKKLDITPALEANILTNMPMRAVCSEECKGLCPKCGKNLNDGDCGCDREYSNPVFEQLMSLFDKEE